MGASSRPSGPSRRAEDADSMALLAVEVAITFLFKVYHTHLILLNFLQTSLMSCMPRSALPVWCVKLSYVVETANSSLCSLCQILCMIPQFLRSGLGCTTWTHFDRTLAHAWPADLSAHPLTAPGGPGRLAQCAAEHHGKQCCCHPHGACHPVLPFRASQTLCPPRRDHHHGSGRLQFIEIDLFSPMACMCCCSASLLSHHKAKDSLPDLKGLLHGNCDCCFLFL